MSKNMLFFLVKLFSNEWSLFVAVALPFIGKKSSENSQNVVTWRIRL
jgi:hypothetical protein